MKGTTTLTLAVAAAMVCLASAQPRLTECPEGFVDFGDGATVGPCLFFAPTKSTWYEMRNLCQTFADGDLAKLAGDLHQDVVDYINSQPDLIDESYWLGGSDEVTEGSWRWVVDDSPIHMGTPNWYPCNGQPNGGTNQNHLTLYWPDYHFQSLEATRQIRGICQIFSV